MFGLTSNSLDDTEKFARKIAAHLNLGDVVGLTGPLGSGKSTFVNALVKVLHRCEYSSSPTFTIIHQYDLLCPTIYHIDLYRIENERSLAELGLEEYLYGNGISLIEWFPNLGDFRPKEYLDIKINCNMDGSRRFEVSGVGKRGEEILDRIRQEG